MNTDELRARATKAVEDAAAAGAPPDRRVVHCEAEARWVRRMRRNVSDHTLNVLARGADIIVFFDPAGREIGWRDDGRTGAAQPRPYAPEALREMIVLELELPPEARLGPVRSVELPPLGWTHEALVFLAPIPKPDQVVRVWVSPDDYRVIQCLFGPFSAERAAS